jgi:deoxyribonuclease-4
MHNAGYDFNNLDKIIDEFDHKIGLSKLWVIHLNDSKDYFKSRKDRHENIGYGTIGFHNLTALVHHPKLLSVPKILETPYHNDQPLYAQEIKMLRDKIFNPSLKKTTSF